MPGFVLARLSAFAPIVLAAVLFAIPADEARAHNDNSAIFHAETYPLHEAAEAGDLDSVNHFITIHMTDVNAKDNDGQTPLYRAAYYRRASAVSILIAAEADVNAKDNNGETPLYQAALRGYVSVASILLVAGADVNAKNNNGETPLYRAAFYSRALVSILIAAGADVNAENNDGETPLYRAALFGRVSAVSILIAAGADVNAKSNSGITPLHRFAFDGRVSAVSILIAAGADVNAKSNSGITPLHSSARYGYVSAVSILIAAGADVNATTNFGWTPLHSSARYGHVSAASVLIAAGADVNAKSNSGSTPLHSSARYGHVSAVSVLIAAGADVNTKNNDGETPLYLVAGHSRSNRVSVFYILIAAGADISAEICGRFTPPQFYDSTAGECAEFKSCLSSATLNRDENICECAGAAVLDGTGLGCECLAPNFGTVEDCQAPSAESCADFYDPPRFYDASAGECAGDLHPCHATAVRKDDNSGCECPPERQFSHGDPSGGSWRSRSTGYCVDKTYGIRRYSRFSCWSSEYREYEWYESIPNSAECVADHAPVAHDLGGWNSAIRANNPTIVAHFIAEHDKDPDSGIHYAVRYHSHLAASVMIENGVNVNHPRYSRAPLHDAVTYGGARMISVFLAANANPDAIDSGGDAPLHFAAKKSDAPETTALISLLLAGGANPNIRNNDDWHPLDLAYHGGNIRLSNGVFARTPKRLLMSALVAGGGNLAQPDGQDGNGDSPLHFETRAGRDEFVLWVLNRGANPDIANNKSETPMHHAAGDFSLPLVKLLAGRGANPDKQDEDGDSPLHKIARGTDTANNTALISLLLDKGANPNLKNNDGWRPLDLAFDDGGERDPRFARRMLMLALIEGGAQWTSECSGGAIPNENYRGLAQVATYPECKCPAHISQRDGGGACECPGHSHSQVNGRCLPQGSAEVDAEIAKMQVELARLRAALVSLNARISLSAEMPREMVEDIAEQARETAAEIDWRRANFVALGRRAEAGEAPPPVALSDTAAECRMRGGEVRIDSRSGTRICLGLDQSGTFCLVDSGDVFSCRGLFKHVRVCNDVYHRPALNAFICAARCDVDETARGKGCE